MIQLTEEQITELARPLMQIVTKFYEDSENEKAYQQWKQEQEMKGGHERINRERKNKANESY